jgi:hypothetical protein
MFQFGRERGADCVIEKTLGEAFIFTYMWIVHVGVGWQ